jgi:hypothetical protein
VASLGEADGGRIPLFAAESGEPEAAAGAGVVELLWQEIKIIIPAEMQTIHIFFIK